MGLYGSRIIVFNDDADIAYIRVRLRFILYFVLGGFRVFRRLTNRQAGGEADPVGLLVGANELLPHEEDGRHICTAALTRVSFHFTLRNSLHKFWGRVKHAAADFPF